MGDRITPEYLLHDTTSKPHATTLENSPHCMPHKNDTEDILVCLPSGMGSKYLVRTVKMNRSPYDLNQENPSNYIYNAAPSTRCRAILTIPAVSNAQGGKR